MTTDNALASPAEGMVEDERIDAIVACLGDDAAELRHSHEEVAHNCDDAAKLIDALRAAYATLNAENGRLRGELSRACRQHEACAEKADKYYRWHQDQLAATSKAESALSDLRARAEGVEEMLRDMLDLHMSDDMKNNYETHRLARAALTRGDGK